MRRAPIMGGHKLDLHALFLAVSNFQVRPFANFHADENTLARAAQERRPPRGD
jgi:hypothetical protein